MPGIPTKGPGGLRFRSRVEAKWAHVFSALGWSWEYEPLDLAGYIPDFIIKLPNSSHDVLVEVKHETHFERLRACVGKIEASGWTGPYLLLGAHPFNVRDVPDANTDWFARDDIVIGMLGAGRTHRDGEPFVHVPVGVRKANHETMMVRKADGSFVRKVHHSPPEFCLFWIVENWCFSTFDERGESIYEFKPPGYHDYDFEGSAALENAWCLACNATQWDRSVKV